MSHTATDKSSTENRTSQWTLPMLALSLAIVVGIIVIATSYLGFEVSVLILLPSGADVLTFWQQVSAFNFFGVTLPWQPVTLLKLVALIVLGSLLINLYTQQTHPSAFDRPHQVGLIFLLLLAFSGGIWLMAAQSGFLYLLPTATLSVMLAVLAGPYFSVLITMLMGLLVGYVADRSLELAVYVMIGGLIGVLSLKGKTAQVNRLLRAGGYVALANIIVVLLFHLSPQAGVTELVGLIAIGVANGILAASLTLSGFFILGSLGVTTSLRLLDLAQLTHPLLQDLLKCAPGTYDHTLNVSKLAEQAAERIGADALLTRVGTYYHDVGKTVHPEYFVENQPDDHNKHDQLAPQESAQIIIDHVEEGLKLARKYHLPSDVQAFIAEHHGTTAVKVFYRQAREQANKPEEVDDAAFRYPGPKPQRKETGILMLADSCESAARAKQPSTPAAFDELVRGIIIERMADDQLNECDLTTHDLDEIRRAFVEIFQGTLHHRIEYPSEPERDHR